MKTFKKEYTLPHLSSQADTLLELLSLALETSGIHDQQMQPIMGGPIIGDNEVWVLTQYHIIVHHTKIKENKTTTIATKLIKMNRFFAHRHFNICQDNQTIIEIYVQFTAIDFENRQLARLNSKRVKELGLVDDQVHYKFPKLKLPNFPEDAPVIPITIQEEHIDENDHVNNLVYIKWCIEATPLNMIQNKKLQIIDVVFGKEIRRDQVVEIRQHHTTIHDEMKLWYDIYNKTRDQQAAQVCMTWK